MGNEFIEVNFIHDQKPLLLPDYYLVALGPICVLRERGERIVQTPSSNESAQGHGLSATPPTPGLTSKTLQYPLGLHLIPGVSHTGQVRVSCSFVSDSLQLLGLWLACQAPLSMGFSRQEGWSRLPRSSPGYLPYSGIEPGCPALQVVALRSEPPGKQEVVCISPGKAGLPNPRVTRSHPGHMPSI